MNRRSAISVPLALVLVAAGPTGLLLSRQDGGKPRIAVVDLRKLFETDAGLASEIAAINARAKEIDTQLGKMRDEYNTLKLECETVPDKSTEKYVRAVAAMFAKEEEIDKYKAGIKAFLETEGTRVNLAAFKRYKSVIADYASKAGLEVVLRQSELDEKDHSLSARAQAAELAVVLYRDPKLDITDAVIQLLKAK